jgi:hypothetical protein
VLHVDPQSIFNHTHIYANYCEVPGSLYNSKTLSVYCETWVPAHRSLPSGWRGPPGVRCPFSGSGVFGRWLNKLWAFCCCCL